jgi:hypothetical protein
VGPHERAVVQVGQDVAVHDEELVGQPVQDLQDRADRAERGVLGRVVDLDSPPPAVADVGADEVPEVADGEGGAVEALLGQLAQHDVEDRELVPDRHQGLG